MNLWNNSSHNTGIVRLAKFLSCNLYNFHYVYMYILLQPNGILSHLSDSYEVGFGTVKFIYLAILYIYIYITQFI